jgi:putative methionine-R-sulfoxide reductase with GAF domain
VTDPKLLKAIEASALLHDMGKLVVPEHILNKPGRLSLAEFEKMKLHASVGADILTAIDFPYPVVPIVRHHHENWDGTGYPGALRGTDIPIGARILAVVDCFDALTSDRPYRPRLNKDEALAILVERRGNMYDPLIVDTFIRVHEEISLAVGASDQTTEALDEIETFTQTSPARSESSGVGETVEGREETSVLNALARELADQSSRNDIWVWDVIAGYLGRLTPSSLCILYLYDSSTDELVARHASGDAAPFVKGLRIERGRRLTGWVAANRQTIINSDPVLDLGEIARAVDPRLRGSVSCPMIWNDQLVGVLTLYSTAADIYSESHQRITEAFAHHVAFALTRGVDVDAVGRRDGMDRVAFASYLEGAPPSRDRFR